VVLPLHDAAGMLPVDRTVCETPILATALEQPRAVRKAGVAAARFVTHWCAVDGYMDHADQHDPWGRPYVFTCGGGKLYVMSLGEDGRSNTADDIWSNE